LSYHHDDPEMRRLLLFLLGGKRGGENRARIIQLIHEHPRNLNQVAKELDLDYKSVQHHIHVLVTSSLIVPSGEGYGTAYKLSQWFEYQIDIFDQVCRSIGLELTRAHEVSLTGKFVNRFSRKAEKYVKSRPGSSPKA
jgi:hypothetical protein